MAVKTIKIVSTVRRAVAVAVFLACLTGTLFFAKWSIGNSISTGAADKQVAATAVLLAPSDPQTHYALAVLTEQTYLAEDMAQSVVEFEKTAAFAPADFRVWMALGRARERNGDPAGAELALFKALSQAPNYSIVHWNLGNILLRKGKTAEAFAEIRQAAATDKAYQQMAVSTAWQIFDEDLAEIKNYLGSSVEMSFELAGFLAKRQKFDEALKIWETLPEELRKTTFRGTGQILAEEMLAAKQYRSAHEVERLISDLGEDNFSVGGFSNAGFEFDIAPKDAGFFEWQIAEGVKPQIGVDDVQHRGGKRSLVILFYSEGGQDFRSVEQKIAVEGDTRYRFETFFKSEFQKTAATLYWEIVDTADGQILASTKAIPLNSNWSDLRTDFTTGEATQAVTVRLAREKCGAGNCAIIGRVWFDDFSLSK